MFFLAKYILVFFQQCTVENTVPFETRDVACGMLDLTANALLLALLWAAVTGSTAKDSKLVAHDTCKAALQVVVAFLCMLLLTVMAYLHAVQPTLKKPCRDFGGPPRNTWSRERREQLIPAPGVRVYARPA